jgi:asparagine synthase (glutamine-hydrolysing)
MCGFFGILQSATVPFDTAKLDAAAGVQSHRGPDDSGLETFEIGPNRLVLGHQRLAIIDLTHAGHQPMTYGDDQGSLVYNGELYNYLELREALIRDGEVFRTQSDTEVLLAALHRWGPERALAQFNWMGAFAWLDRDRGRLVLARDPGSEKPLYYTIHDRQLIFASEVKTLLTLSGRKFDLNRDVIGQFLFQGLIDGTVDTFFQGVTQLEPSSYAEVPLDADRFEVRPVPYQPPLYSGDPASLSLPDFIEEVRRVFVDSVRLRLRSDVRIGVLLSGGIDSSSIAAVTQTLVGRENAPQLLSATSDDPRFCESAFIGIMERHLNQTADRITLRTDPGTLVDDLSTVNWFNDAPASALSAVGHYKMMKRARELGVTVILSGQGADEILLGYRKYLGFYLQSLLRQRRVLSAVGALSGFVANRTIVNQFDVSDAKRYVPFLRTLSSAVNGFQSEISIQGEWLKNWTPVSLGLGPGSLADRQVLDVRRFSVPGLCHYEDRMSMAMSREIRLPFLDPRLIDLLIRAPDDYKLRRGWTKYSFRKAMEPMLPPEICWRKDKQGFSNPQGEWLKHELREAVNDAFSDNGLIAKKGIVDSRKLLWKYERYCRQPAKGGTIWYREILAPFSLELWMRRYESSIN